MKSIVLIGTLFLAAFSPVSTSSNDEVRLSYFRIEEQGSNFILTWQSDVEEAARTYEVQRRTTYSNGQYVLVEEYEPHGTGRQYLYKDDQVFKSAADAQEVVEYRLIVVYQSGAREILASKSVNYTSTALRRTWGSIKAMF